MNKLATAYARWSAIDNINDLRKNKLTLAEYNTIWDMFMVLNKNKKAECIQKACADWFKKMNFEVVEKGIGWEVRI